MEGQAPPSYKAYRRKSLCRALPHATCHHQHATMLTYYLATWAACYTYHLPHSLPLPPHLATSSSAAPSLLLLSFSIPFLTWEI